MPLFRFRQVATMDLLSRAALHFATCSALSLASMHASKADDRMALWHVVHDQCVVDQKTNQSPSPCETVNLTGGENHGYAILKDRKGKTQFLLIPTKQIAGIESPEILSPDAPSYWQAAWEARKYVIERLGHELPRGALGMAINSSIHRGQDQLHIHIDCIQSDVLTQVGRRADEVPQEWSELTFDLSGRRYMAKRVNSADLEGVNPFQLLAQGIEAARMDMSRETLAVIGARFADGHDGFILLSDRVDPATGYDAHGEDLLDHACAIADVAR
jgi:CDP-diacylglycerol pyrophosphatase